MLLLWFRTGTCETSRLGLVSLKSRTFVGLRPGLGFGLQFEKTDNFLILELVFCLFVYK